MLTVIADTILNAVRVNAGRDIPENKKHVADRYIPTRHRTESRIGRTFNPLTDLW